MNNSYLIFGGCCAPTKRKVLNVSDLLVLDICGLVIVFISAPLMRSSLAHGS